MDGERISLRLESEDLEILDEFIERHPEYSNRSNLARVAIREYIETSDGANPKTRSLGEREVIIKLPKALYKALLTVVDEGFFDSIGEVVLDCTRKEYLNADAMKAAAHKAQISNGTVEIIEK